MSLSLEELQDLTKSLIEDPEKISALSDEQVIQLQKHINPFGNVLSNNESHINLSIMNWRVKWLQKFTLTAVIAYLYRVLDEWDCDNMTQEIAVIDAKYKKALDSVGNNNSESARIKAAREEELKILQKTSRAISRKFLDKNLKFDPDRHVRVAASSAEKDPERLTLEAMLNKDYRGDNLDTNAADKHWLLGAYNSMKSTRDSLSAAINALEDPKNDREDVLHILRKKQLEIDDQMEGLACTYAPRNITKDMITNTREALENKPPADVYYNLNRYIHENFEAIRSATEVLYAEKPDIEFSVIYYDHHKSEEEAKDYRVAHNEEFRADVFSVSNKGVHLLGPFKENRKRIDFYNSHTEVIKRMMEQMELDHKLGKDLMEKKIKRKKAQNIAQEGPDAPGLRSYSSAVNTISELGAKKVLTREEQDKLNEAHRTKEQAEVPDGAIQVDMFYPTRDPITGEEVLKKTNFYTQAEAPLHMEEGSIYRDKYQPRRENSEAPVVTANKFDQQPPSQRTKKIVSRYGDVKEPKDV